MASNGSNEKRRNEYLLESLFSFASQIVNTPENGKVAVKDLNIEVSITQYCVCTDKILGITSILRKIKINMAGEFGLWKKKEKILTFLLKTTFRSVQTIQNIDKL